jgi:16S rRNA (uracil1498-N3)-methyltransferase
VERSWRTKNGIYNLQPMHERFFAPDMASEGDLVRLSADEGRHLAQVMRLRVGDSVRVFNGRGLERAGQVADIQRGEVSIALGEPVAAAPEARTVITLAQAVLKGDCMDGVVRDAVMLGVAVVAPVITARVEGDRRSHAAGMRVRRWERIAVASAKQCGRAVVPPIRPPVSLGACLEDLGSGARIALVEPGSLASTTLRQLAAGPPPASATVFVGPEGGWADDDLRVLASGSVLGLTLGGRILRAESAALVGLSALHAAWGEFD